MSIKAIFYSKFDPQQGPIVAHQVPEDSVLLTDLSSSTASHPGTTLPSHQHPHNSNALLSFPTISRFLIPRQSLCGNLISLSPPPLTPRTPPLTLLTLPTCIESRHYDRNEFIYTFTLALHPQSDIPSYKSVLTKLTSLTTHLEEQSHFLSSDTSAPNTGKIYSLCEMLMEDLNNYAECMIPIDDLNTLNIKLFPTLPSPPRVQAWHVPLFVVRIETMIDENWDLTMQRIIPFINGVNSVKRIAGLADADLKLSRKCVRHLVYYGCVILLDIFSFNAIYAPTSEFGSMIARDEGMQRECARYVNTKFTDRPALVTEEAVVDDRRMQEDDIWPIMPGGEALDGVGIVQLFANLGHGVTVREWYALNAEMLTNVDVRRFVTFGVIKGFLYRVHRYAVRTGKRGKVQQRDVDVVKSKVRRKDDEEDDNDENDLNSRLLPFLDGTHCFDEICTELQTSERELIDRLESKELGEVVIICR